MARQRPQKPTWQKRQKLMQALVQEAFRDEAIREVRNEVLALLQQAPVAVGPANEQGRLDLESLTKARIGDTYYRSPDLVRWYFAFAELRQRLMELARQRVPKLRAFSREDFEDFLTLALLPVPDPCRRAAKYLAPDTPAKVLPTGDLLVPKGSRLDKYQAGQIRDFVNAGNPGKRGRPGKPRAVAPKPPRQPSPEEVQKVAFAYRNHHNGISKIETARELFPDLDLGDKRREAAAVKRVDRLIYNHEKWQRQKLQGRTP